MNTLKYVIIGNSTAGIGAVEGIRQIDKTGEITIISDEIYHAYSRPLISYFLQGKVTEEKMKYRSDSFYEENYCTLISSVTATKICVTEKTVVLSDERQIPYDKLLIATGSSAYVPNFKGLEAVKNKHTFMSLEQAKKLKCALKQYKNILIIGAGLIGLKCAEGISGKETDEITDTHIKIIDLSERILPRILDDEGAKLVQTHLENKGLEFKLGSAIKRFEENCAILENEERIEFDVLILAVGVRPNVGLLKDIAKIEHGIVINDKSETSAPDIYAAGDCTQTTDVSSGESKVMALLPNAYIQGECAGINMASGKKNFNKAIPMNAIGFFGLHILTAGNYTGEAYSKIKNGSYKRLFYDNNKLNGYILIGDVDKGGIYTSLIRECTPLNTIDFKLVCEKPGLMAFSKEVRKSKLGGETK